MFKRFTQKRRIRHNRSLSLQRRPTLHPETKRGIAIVLLFTVSLFSLLSFFQATGAAGEVTVALLGNIFGTAGWFVPVLLLILTYFLMRPSRYEVKPINYFGLVLVILSYSGLMHLSVRTVPLKAIMAQGRGGGFIGYVSAHYLYSATELFGTSLILGALLIIGLFIFFNVSFKNITALWQKILEHKARWQLRREARHADRVREEIEVPPEAAVDEKVEEPDIEVPLEEPADKKPAQLRVRPLRKRYQKIDIPLDLLTLSEELPASGDIKANMKRIEETLRGFGIEVTMGEVNIGPTVTQYTLKPLEGVKLNQITTLHSDLALALAAHPIRIEAPIPGKSLVGIEVPNQRISIVKLKEILESPVFHNRKSTLMLSLGKDVSGKVMMADLEKMPHLLIAGATGSGKSVSINSMAIGLLYQNSPEELKFILIDPKRVELSSYDGIPHLITPVVHDIDKTINALRWAVRQMDERYRILSRTGKKNIELYNASRLVDKMPYIIIIVDELADLMMVAPKEIEGAIVRLAQMARAVGIHLILATQRPSVNVITGLIKANITSRIAFAVASAVDSRTIIDSAGAEKLLGRGDMLYMSAELSKPKRMQGALVSEQEIISVTNYLKERAEPQYDPSVIERQLAHAGLTVGYDETDEESDVQRAIEVVVRAKRASATLLQSRMRVGFAKASRLLDILEDRGIIGPQVSSKPRDVLITEDDLSDYLTPRRTLNHDGVDADAEFVEDLDEDEEDQEERT